MAVGRGGMGASGSIIIPAMQHNNS